MDRRRPRLRLKRYSHLCRVTRIAPELQSRPKNIHGRDKELAGKNTIAADNGQPLQKHPLNYCLHSVGGSSLSGGPGKPDFGLLGGGLRQRFPSSPRSSFDSPLVRLPSQARILLLRARSR